MNRYYIQEHEQVYREIADLGYEQWNDLFDGPDRWTYDDFQNRAFLEHVIKTFLPELTEPVRVLEYGCGTGPAACFMASRGYAVDALDLVPEAIKIAKSRAEDRGLKVNFRAADICKVSLEELNGPYDVILDSYCLQSIVMDEDRESLFSTIRGLLKPGGIYVISTALQNPDREIGDDHYFDSETDILYRMKPEGVETDEVIQIHGRYMIPQRRHRTGEGIANELIAAGFTVLENGAQGSGNIVCRVASPTRYELLS